MVDRGEIADEIDVDALVREALGITQIGARFEFDAAGAVQDQHGGARPGNIGSVSRQLDRSGAAA